MSLRCNVWPTGFPISQRVADLLMTLCLHACHYNARHLHYIEWLPSPCYGWATAFLLPYLGSAGPLLRGDPLSWGRSPLWLVEAPLLLGYQQPILSGYNVDIRCPKKSPSSSDDLRSAHGSNPTKQLEGGVLMPSGHFGDFGGLVGGHGSWCERHRRVTRSPSRGVEHLQSCQLIILCRGDAIGRVRGPGR